MVNFVTLGQPPQGRRGVRLGTRPCGRQRSSAGPAGWGHCRPRAALRLPPAPGARGPPHPGAQLSPPPRPPLSPGPQALTNLPAGMQRTPIRAPDNLPRPARSHLRLGILKFQGPRLPGWTPQARHRPHWGSGNLDSTGSDQTEEGKPTPPRAETPGGSPVHLNVGPLLPHPAQAVAFLSLCPADFTPHPARSPNSDFEPKRVQECLRPGHSQQALWPSASGHHCPWRGNPTVAGSCFPKLYPGEVRGIH